MGIMLNFSPVLLHVLLLCKVELTTLGEIHFGLGNERVRFGRLEDALKCGFNMECGPSVDEENEHNINRLVKEHLNGVPNVKFSVLVTVFNIC